MGFTKNWQEDFADVNVHDDLYNSANPAIKFVHRARIEAIAQEVEKLGSKNLLEVACGDGFVLEEISKNKNPPKLTGVEISEKRIERCKQKGFPANYVLASIEKMPFKDEEFDAVVATEILEHIPDYEKAIAELKRVTKKGGHIIITFPNELNLRLGRLAFMKFPIKFQDHFNAFIPGHLDKHFGKKVLERGVPWGPFIFSLTHLVIYEKE